MIEAITFLLGGLGAFLVGFKLVSDNIEKLANAFSVSEAFIMWGQEEKNPTTETDSEMSIQKKELIQKVMQMSDEELQKIDLLLRIVESK